jgi:hypothetical protein
MFSVWAQTAAEHEVFQAFAVVAYVALAISFFLIFRRERSERLAAERRAMEAVRALQSLESSPHADDARTAERNDLMFEQHRRMNQLTIAKLEAELQLMQLQLAQRTLNEDRIEAGKEFHELMVEKTKLEMDSLRLHIAEVRKRMEDWNTD